ncbi:hypothetical protein [Halomicrobium urmianum]|uniref:hypothetical protein n=1 Tax=Halomicrobium urmianum TaxID=1586233 RepID=UPI001CD9B364|nr:hypothetical protein [Halomicrobium urmianum]
MTETSRPWAQGALAAAGVAWAAWAVWMTVVEGTEGRMLLAVGLSGLLTALGFVGVVFRLPWTYKFPGGEGAGIGALGALVFGVGQSLAAILGGDPIDWLVAPGVLGLVGGTGMLAFGMVRARRTPPWIGVALALSAVLFLGFGDGAGLRSLLALPFGLALLAAGAYLARYPERPTTHLEPSAITRESADPGDERGESPGE